MYLDIIAFMAKATLSEKTMSDNTMYIQFVQDGISVLEQSKRCHENISALTLERLAVNTTIS